MAGIRTTRSRLLYTTALAGAIRMSRARLILGVGNPGPIKMTRSQFTAAVGMPSLLYATHVSLLKIQSPHRIFYLGRLESTSTVTSFTANGGNGGEDGHGWELELVAGPIPEFNPYKPQVPESLIDIPGAGREFFDYIEENQKTLRLQHNITQAGDTTFPYQLIINTHTERQYTLGAIGKFYHEDYGVILARYVRFEKMSPNVSPTSPVGLIAKAGTLDWVVTNRLELSSPYLVVGVSSSYVTPLDGEYGWVTVDGVNLQTLVNDSDSWSYNEPFVWSASGAISNEGEGTILGRRVNEPTAATLLKGQAWIRLESLSKGAIVKALDDYIQIIAQLQEDVEQLQEVTGVNGELSSLQSQLTVLSNRLTAEENARKAADTAINKRISDLNFVTAAQLNAAIHNVETAMATITLQLQSAIQATNDIAVEALQKANQALSVSTDFILEQINLILGLIAQLDSRAKGRFPVVDGLIPPNLVYDEDGSLVYVETF